MIRANSFLLACCLVSACASNTQGQHEVAIAQPTPTYWTLDKQWLFTLLDKEGRIESVMTLKFTGRIAETCSSGDWREIEIERQNPPAHPEFIGEPAYILQGHSLKLNFTSNLCDSYTDLKGTLGELGFVGERLSGGMLGSVDLGSAYGIQIN